MELGTIMNKVMKLKKKYFVSAGLFWLLFTHQAFGQIRADQTLPHNSTVKSVEGIILIEGGTHKGSNLFHSFQDFSVLTGQEAFFNNANQIQNIFSRVTGSSISQINGIIRANGTANLFFLNPNGIVFGSGASLNLGGSFVASTAQELIFADGSKFSTIPENSDLLTMSVPIGLGLSNQSGAIRVENRGADQIFINPNPLFSPFIVDESLRGLQVTWGKSLILVGRNILLEGARLTSLAGRIELVSIDSGTINFQLTEGNLELSANFSEKPIFHDLKILDKTFIDTKGGSINIQGKNVEIEKGSVIALQNLATISGKINILASELLRLSGTNQKGNQRAGILTETLGNGSTSGSIEIVTNELKIEDGAVIGSRAFAANGGDIEILANDSIQLSGVSHINPSLSSSITSITLSSSQAGEINIKTNDLKVEDGGFITSGTFSSGKGGDVVINARESIELIGVAPSLSIVSTLAASSLNSGDAGNLIINTTKLKVLEGARIDSSTLNTGNGGNIIISAFDSIEVNGKAGNSLPISSSILSSANFLEPELQELFQVNPLVTGNSGKIEIDTNSLIVTNEGIISVTNQGTGNGGNINIKAGKITLDGGNISATTVSGKGGNINLQAQDISLINNSNISATAGGKGDGGNININSDSLLMKDQSQITADAFEGQGGNILINTEVFLVSNDSVITATSELGIDGVVEINTPENNLESVIVPIKAQILEFDPNIAQRCLNQKGEKGLFLMKGKDAIPTSTEDHLEVFEEESTPQFIDITENMSEAQKNFYHQHLPPNVMLRTETGDLSAINLCLKDFLVGK